MAVMLEFYYSYLIDKPYGQKPFKTEVNFTGKDDQVKSSYDHLALVTTELYTNFGRHGMPALNS